MTSKIDGYKASQPVLSANAKSGVKASVGKPADARVGDTSDTGADHLTLTDSARSLQKLSEAVANTPVVDSGKVESAKLAISNGTYKIDSGRIADKMLAFESVLK